ncbi:MAG TPA: helix-turn-helix domain-containing protein, partial [Actinomycetes bacterium]
ENPWPGPSTPGILPNMSLGVSTDTLRAVAHPVRLRILSLLTGAPMSAAEVARELDISHANASYHVRQLVAAGLLDLAEERSNRGGRERRYRHVPETAAPLESDAEGRQLWWRALAEELVRRSALADDEYGDSRGTSADAELWVAPADWAEAVDRVRSAVADLHRAARPPHAAGAHHVSVTVALFGMQP